MENPVDQRSGRLIIWFVGILALIGMIGYLLLVYTALGKPPDQVAQYVGAIAGTGPFVGVLVGGLVNAMTTRSGSNVTELSKVVELTHVAPDPATLVVHPDDVAGFKKA